MNAVTSNQCDKMHKVTQKRKQNALFMESMAVKLWIPRIINLKSSLTSLMSSKRLQGEVASAETMLPLLTIQYLFQMPSTNS